MAIAYRPVGACPAAAFGPTLQEVEAVAINVKKALKDALAERVILRCRRKRPVDEMARVSAGIMACRMWALILDRQRLEASQASRGHHHHNRDRWVGRGGGEEGTAAKDHAHPIHLQAET